MLFKDYYQNAPEKIQEWVDSFESSDLLAQIAANHGIDNGKGVGNRELGRLSGQVLVGMLHPKDFVPSLVEKLNVPKEKAQEIAKEVNQKIFSPVKDLLIELYKLEKNEKTAVEEQKQEFLPKKEPVEIGVPQKPEQPTPTFFSNNSARLPLPPIKKEETLPAVPPAPPAPQVPQNKQEEKQPSLVNSSPFGIKIPTPTPSVPQKQVTINEMPLPKKEEVLLKNPSLEIRNPFEEKLRQTFTIPSKELPKESFPKKISEEEIEREKKKEAITKDPYLETPE